MGDVPDYGDHRSASERCSDLWQPATSCPSQVSAPRLAVGDSDSQ